MRAANAAEMDEDYWYLEWLENKDYVRSEFLQTDRQVMLAKIQIAKARLRGVDVLPLRAATSVDEIPEADVDDTDSPLAAGGDPVVETQSVADTHSVSSVSTIPNPESMGCDTSPPVNESLCEGKTQCNTEPEGNETIQSAIPFVPVSECPSDDAGAKGSRPNESTTGGGGPRQARTIVPPPPVAPPRRDTTPPPRRDTTPPPQEGPPPPQEDYVEERENLLRQIDLLRMRFKDARIPANIDQNEAITNNEIRRVVNRNVMQLRRNRNVATYKLGMVGSLLLMELFFARFCRLDMSRFMKWHYSNMHAYEELLVDLGDVTTPLTDASGGVQLAALLLFNTFLFIANEMLLKFFNIDVLHVMASITGAEMTEGSPRGRPTPPPPPPDFTQNFRRHFSE